MIRYLLVTLFLIIIPLSTTFSQGDDQYNMYTDWLKLSLTGKSQEEIEFSFRGVSQETLEKLKTRMRNHVIENLKRMGLQKLILRRRDVDDLHAIREKILTEIRFSGMQSDKELVMEIKEEFGVKLNTL